VPAHSSCSPATLTLRRAPIFIASSPDASCLFSIGLSEDNGLILEAYHWASFTSAQAYQLELARPVSLTPHCITVTSFIERKNVHIVFINVERSMCHSYVINISKIDSPAAHSNKSYIGCLFDVWTQFPVVPAISRATITCGRAPPRIIFVAERDQYRYATHFAESIRALERTTCKPTDGRLAAITAVSFSVLTEEVFDKIPLSCLRAGEWLLDAVCIIPIQLAIILESRFVPLKDGVWSAELEHSLFNASVNTITNGLSLGWYESIFLYPPYVHRPVKVISTMGEQSAGKSYSVCLLCCQSTNSHLVQVNHLVDTSFTGSAMRCTEGVWMSCTPTSDALIVSLDFETVRSIGRPTQEDMLMVLFKSAISNMILVRGGFALSWDIAGLFSVSFCLAIVVLSPLSVLRTYTRPRSCWIPPSTPCSFSQQWLLS